MRIDAANAIHPETGTRGVGGVSCIYYLREVEVVAARGTTSSRRYRKLKATFKADCQARGAVCWLCGQAIDYTIPHRDPDTGVFNADAFELDHMHPRSTHPDLAEDPANFRPAHRACNGKRGNKMPKQSIGRLSRQWHIP